MKTDSHITLEIAREALATIVMAYTRMMMAALPDTRKFLRLSQKLGVVVRRHTRIHHKLVAHILREDLSLCAKLRARVCRELGGKMAMVNWERRRRDAKVMASCRAARLAKGETRDWPRPRFDKPAPPRIRQSPRKPWVAKTDRLGHYRMAVIETGKLEKIRTKPKRRHVTSVITRNVKFHPVEVTTDDLRIDVYVDDRFPPPQNQSSPSSGHAPRIDRPPIH